MIILADDPETEAVIGQWLEEHGYPYKTGTLEAVKSFIANHIEGMLEEVNEHIKIEGQGHPDNLSAYIDLDSEATAKDFTERIMKFDGGDIHASKIEGDGTKDTKA